MASQVGTKYLLCLHRALTTNAEEFNKYLSYVRNLGFEDTPDYDYLRDLFTQALKNTGEIEDGEYDWMKLNNGKGWEAMKHNPNNYLTAAHHVPNSSAKALGPGAGTPRGPPTPGINNERLNAPQPPPPSPGKPGVGKTRDRVGGSAGAPPKRQSAVGGPGDAATPTASTQAQFQNSMANLPHRMSQGHGAAVSPQAAQNARQQTPEQKPTAMQKLMRVLCCSR